MEYVILYRLSDNRSIRVERGQVAGLLALNPAQFTETVPSSQDLSIVAAADAAVIDRAEFTAQYPYIEQDILDLQGTVQRVAPVTTDTVSATSGLTNLLLMIVPAQTLAALSLEFPISPVDGQKFRIKCSQDVTSLTVFVSEDVASVPTSLSAGYDRQFIFDEVGNIWV